MDDWRGEHLIRARPKAGFDHRWTAHGGSMVSRRAESAICAVPGCDNALYDRNTSGVCRHHNHHPDFCGCAPCMQTRTAQAART